MSHDRLALLSQIRPTSAVDRAWDARDQDAALARVLADTAAPAPARRRRRTRAAAIAAGLAASVVAAPGVAAAVGDGMRPQAFLDVYSYWATDNPQGVVQAGTARRAATAPGPDGNQFSVLMATNSEGTTCLAPVIESGTSADRETPDLFTDGGSLCVSADAAPQPIGPILVSPTDTATIWYGDAGDGTRAELTMPDGTNYPALVVDGYLFGWYPLPDGTAASTPTLTVYGADGTVLHRGAVS
jgi:hypothetical protein